MLQTIGIIGNLIKVKTLLLFCLLCCFAFAGLCCKDEPTKPTADTTFALIVEDATCTEVYLRLEIGSRILTRDVMFKRDTITLFTRTLNEAETIILDTNLAPNHTYTYQAILLNSSLTSSTIVQTMDTTSHDFNWQTYTIGDSTGSSVLHDVAIINDTLAYAVGEIYQGGTTYNAVKWNGQTWELLRIQFLYFCNQSDTFPFPAKAIWAFDENNIWITSGSQVVRWNGQTQSSPECIPVSVLKLWGENSNSICAVGYNGGIAHYNGSTWTKLESPAGAGGTTVDLLDVYGSPDGNEVWTCGWDSNTGEGIIIRGKDAQWQIIWHSLQSIPHVYYGELLGSLWIGTNKQYFITGSGNVFRQSVIDIGTIRIEPVNLGNYAYRIRGNRSNDVTLVGDAAMIWHFNGVTWMRYDNLMNLDDRLRSLAVTPTMVISVGRTYRTFPTQAMVIIGRR